MAFGLIFNSGYFKQVDKSFSNSLIILVYPYIRNRFNPAEDSNASTKFLNKCMKFSSMNFSSFQFIHEDLRSKGLNTSMEILKLDISFLCLLLSVLISLFKSSIWSWRFFIFLCNLSFSSSLN